MSTAGWWILGYAVGGAVVLVAAALLVTIIFLAQRIVRQAAAITLALDGAMRNTTPLFDLAMMNHAIESITRGLEKMRNDDDGGEDERSLGRRVADRLLGDGSP